MLEKLGFMKRTEVIQMMESLGTQYQDSLYVLENQIFSLEEESKQWKRIAYLGESEYTLDETDRQTMALAAYNCYYKNPLGRSIINHLLFYIFGRGAVITAQDRNPAVQKYLNEIEDRDKKFRLWEMIFRTLRDGECFIQRFANKTYPRRRYIDAHEIEDIETDPDDITEVQQYIWKNSSMDESKPIPADEIQHIKICVDSNVKRGRPWVEPVLRRLTQYENWLADRVTLNHAMAAIFLEIVVEGSPSDISTVNQRFEEASKKSNKYAGTSTGISRRKVPGSGTIAVHGANEEWKWANPQVNAEGCKEDGRQMRLNIASGVQLPEYLLTSDAANANYCVDEKTEILTKAGWKSIYEINNADHFGTLNAQNNLLEYQKATDIFVNENYSQGMISINGKHNLDLLVTPNHRLYVSSHQHRKRNGKLIRDGIKDFHFVEAGKLNKHEYLIKGAPERFDGEKPDFFILPGIEYEKTNFRSKNKPDRKIGMQIWLEFLGYFISEGWILNTNKKKWVVGISQKIGPIAQKINDCLYQMPINWQSFCNKKGMRTWEVFDKALWFWLKKNVGAGSKNKKIPEFVNDLDSSFLSVLFNALILGDGSIRQNGSKYYFSVSPKLADQVQILGLKLGHISIIGKTMANGVLPVILKNNNRKIAISPANHVKQTDYSGIVWCVTVPNGLIITRRNGKPAIHGNSSTLVAESPFVRMIEFLQTQIFEPEIKQMKREDIKHGVEKKVIPALSTETVLKSESEIKLHALEEAYKYSDKQLELAEKMAIIQGDEDNYIDRECPTKTEVDLQWPPIVSRKLKDETDAYAIHDEMGYASKQTISSKLGYDYEEEKRLMDKMEREKENKETPEPDEELLDKIDKALKKDEEDQF